MNRRTEIILLAAVIGLGCVQSGYAQIVANGLVLNLEAGNNPLAVSSGPAVWADLSGGASLSGPNAPIILYDANTYDAAARIRPNIGTCGSAYDATNPTGTGAPWAVPGRALNK